MPTALGSPQANVVNGKIYVMGGLPNTGTNNGTLNEVYDPSTNTWSLMSPMPQWEDGCSAVFNNKIYFLGGYFNHDLENPEVPITQIYDPDKNTWSLGTPPPTFFAEGSAAVTSGILAPKRIYAFCPYANQVYDPETDSWASGAAIPTQRAGFAVAVVDDLIYVIGGESTTFPTTLSYTQPFGSNGVTTYYATVEQYTPFGYGTVPPVISVASPENSNYSSSEVSLNFTVNKPANWTSYSLDGKQNVTITVNTTITGLSSGLHNITVYANDTFGNIGASQTVTFTIAEPFPTATVAAVSGALAVVVVVGLFVYFKKRKH
jgi:hypothetical protein